MSELKAMAELFEGRHFDREVIILCVRWYLRFKLSLRDLVDMVLIAITPQLAEPVAL
jgi:transposase-like protein